MKTIGFFLLLVSVQCCFGQTDTNSIAIGNWSETVADKDGYLLRGRLLVYDAEGLNKYGIWQFARVYMELQHVGVRGFPMEFYVDDMKCLNFELHDALGRPAPGYWAFTSRTVPEPFTVTLPGDSILRLRVDRELGSTKKPDGLMIGVNGGDWAIRPDATNDYFLSATFSPPTNHIVSGNNHLWRGMLKLPGLKIPVKKQ